MHRSTSRILTTHTGSLPRPPDLVAMLNATDVPVDELLAANLRYTAACHRGGGAEFLNLAGRELAQLLRADYARLTAILRRCLSPSEVG